MSINKPYLLHRTLPGWMILLSDSLMCAVSFLLAMGLQKGFAVFLSPVPVAVFYGALVVAGVCGLCFFLFKTHRNLLRFSGVNSLVRLVSALAVSVVTLLIINVLMQVATAGFLSTTILITFFFVASFITVSQRLIIRSLYGQKWQVGDGVQLVIFGEANTSFQLKNAIEAAANGSYKVVAYVDENPHNIGKTIDNVPVLHPDHLPQLTQVEKIDLLLFSQKEIEWNTKHQLVEYCLANDIQIKNVPPAEEWIKGQLSMAMLKEVRIEELLDRPPIDLKKTAVESFLKNKRILITGAAGSIGSEIARQVAAIAPTLLVLCDQNETGLHHLDYELENSFPNCNDPVVYICDIRDANAVENLFRRFKPDIVFHAAAYKHVPVMEFHPSEAIRNNVLGTKVLADLSIKYGVEKFLFISTDKAINPTNIMGASKRLAEIYVQSLGNRNRKVVNVNRQQNEAVESKVQIGTAGTTKFITTRFGNVLGSNGSVIERFRDQIANGGPVTVTDPEIIRYFMTISEACSLVLEAVTMGKGSEIFIFDMGEPVKILDLARKMIRLSGLTPGKDIQIKFTGLRPGEKLYEELLNKKEQVIPTHHPKILIAKVVEYDFYEITRLLDDLIQKAVVSQDEEVVRQMKSMLPEFVSKNSLYTSFDEINPDNLAASH